MLSKFMFGALAATTALTALPAAANAQYYRDGYHRRSYDRDYRDYRRYPRHRSRTNVYIGIDTPAYYGGYYGRPAYYGGYYAPSYYPTYYDQGYYGRGYYDRGYYGRSYYRGGYRCGSGTTGAIVGGAAGALVGREIARGGYRYRRGNGTTGAIIGGALGALVGSEATRC